MNLQDVIAHPVAPERWLLLNVFTKTCVGLNGQGLAAYSLLSAGQEPGPEKQHLWDIERFSNMDGLMADPSRFKRDANEWGDGRVLAPEEFKQELRDHLLLPTQSESDYLERFGNKKSLLDRTHFGNFHQQVGQELFFRRIDPGKWWVEQKFAADRKTVRTDNLYGAVQAEFLKRYFPDRLRPGMDVIDLGCGIGLYSGQMADCGANVTGLDPDEKYLAIAREQYGDRVRFQRCDIGKPGGLDAIPDESADLIFMSDALLFYYVPVNPKETASLDVLLSDIHRILKPSGVFASMEPHSVFWLAPWFGSPRRPFTLLTEYAQKFFGVTPTLERIVNDLGKNGLAVSHMEEVKPPPDLQGPIGERDLHFARNFPVWHIFESRKSWPSG